VGRPTVGKEGEKREKRGNDGEEEKDLTEREIVKRGD